MLGAKSMFDAAPHTGDPYIHQITVATGSPGRGSGYGTWAINSPNGLLTNPVPIFHIHASRFPNGITITDCGIGLTPSAANYNFSFKHGTSPTDASLTTIETVATGGVPADEAEDDGTIDNGSVPAGNWVFFDVSSTFIEILTVWITFRIN